jgi:hypothetical protein
MLAIPVGPMCSSHVDDNVQSLRSVSQSRSGLLVQQRSARRERHANTSLRYSLANATGSLAAQLAPRLVFQRRLKISEKLFAGIASMSGAENP